ncbi:hypothetical protein D3C85_1109530 [compost metagenome]
MISILLLVEHINGVGDHRNALLEISPLTTQGNWYTLLIEKLGPVIQIPGAAGCGIGYPCFLDRGDARPG